MADFDRSEIVALLDRLGAPDQDTVVEAARSLHRKVNECGLTWDGLLRVDLRAFEGRENDPYDDAPADAALANEQGEPADGGAAEATRLIGRLLARKDISDDLREDLTGMKRSIAEGNFDAMDQRYIRALAKRLGA